LLVLHGVSSDPSSLMESETLSICEEFRAVRGGPGCLNRLSASISGASSEVRLPSGGAAA
jgi:hypothetical protein